jgi:pSer/pThr/pTyr-binding forkhead associated (FHA) protein
MKKLSLEAFMDACGGHGPLCLEVASPNVPVPFRQVLNQPFALLGRHERADVCLRDPLVSKRHALVQLIAGRFFCLDLGSRTGTHWDAGGHVRGWLSCQAPFRVGPYRLWLTAEDAASALGTADTPDAWDPFAKGSLNRYGFPSVVLDISNNGKTLRRWRMNRVVAIVGTAETCKVRLRGHGISRFHCALVCTPAGVWVIDLQRLQGVQINGMPVNHSLLEEGDQLELGNFTICVRYDCAAAESTPVEGSEGTAEGLQLADRPGRESGNEIVPGFGGAMKGLTPWGSAGPSDVDLLAASVGSLPAEAWNAEMLPSLLRQFGQMQHRMFDQSLFMMFQMFRTMHGEHVGALREELQRLDELNRELHTLLMQRLNGPAPSLLSASAAQSAVSAVPAAREQQPDRATPAAAAHRQTTPMSAAPQATAAVPDEGAGSNPDKTASASRPAAAAAEDIHLLLCKRMEEIEKERQGVWERIIGRLRKN